MGEDLAGTVSYLFELGMLKRARRTGWWIAGVRDPESIAEHSFRTAILGSILAAMEGADPARTSLLCTYHDTQETRIGDIPRIGRRYLTAASNESVTADQVAKAPDAVAEMIRSVVAEYEQGETLEAVVARDADKLECLIQAVEYRHQGYADVQRWVDSSRSSLKTGAAIRIADTVESVGILDWLR
ncbi:haloacid dehalogenase [Catellatospora sp. TT07R-123]|uniref:HD domain-containing protein n=1 Tax=Catellatospora sp. TT07R-123 TaxID=2733863 RepID=UPI001B24FE06|nr:HD domain-containing protein [Catellatospora sp. TT07R-123]GHJ49122.1 haloacid dehalogenase [Catellatospora sp. TT07R-123]